MIDRKTGYVQSNTMRELIQDNHFLLHVISRFDIAYGFGDETIEKVCAGSGADAMTFLAVCNCISGYPFDTAGISLKSLVGYLRHAHRSIVSITLPHIRHHLVEGIGHAAGDKVSLLLLKFFDEYVGEVRTHMAKEEDDVFRYAELLADGKKSEIVNLRGYVDQHEPMSEKLRELKDIFIYHYHYNDTDMLSSVLFDIILCERDLCSHFEVENRLLIPIISSISQANADPALDPKVNDRHPSLLGEREKDIIRHIAYGLTNKQIADRLFISTHTVATHRRNICSKLDIHTSSGLTLYAIMNNLIDISDVSL